MARRRRNSSRSGRVPNGNASRPRLLPRAFSLPPVTLPALPDLRPIEDRRTFHPAPHVRPALATVRSATRLVLRQRPAFRQPSQTKALVSFADPRKVMICLRRARRREVLHAKRVAGRIGLRRPRRNAFSKISCR